MKLSELSSSEIIRVSERFALASNVYDDNSNSSVKLAGGWQRVFNSSEVPGLNDRGFYGSLYKRTVNGRDEHVIAFRGMDGIKDLDDVAKLALGIAPAQLTDAYKFSKIAAEKFNIDRGNVEYVGHSMGGYLSKAVGLLNNSFNIYAFNSPGLFKEDLKGLPRRIMREFGENKADITENRIERSVMSINSKFDFVTWVGELSGKTIKLNTDGRPHQLMGLENSFNRAAREHEERRVLLPAPMAAYRQPMGGLAMA